MQFRVSDYIHVFQSALWQLNSTHIFYSGTTIVFDAAYLPAEIQAITKMANNHQPTNGYLAYTHGDFDHIVGNKWFDGFEQVGSLALTQRQDIYRILGQIKAFDQENYILRPYQVSYPDLDYKLDIKDSSSIKLGSLEIIVFKAGGHTADGLFYVIPELKLWIAGDYLSDIEFPFIEDSIEEYYKTLNRAREILISFDIDFLIPGHGLIAFTKAEMASRIQRSFTYLDSLNTAISPDWRTSWGNSPFEIFLDKMHRNNLAWLHK